MFVSATNAPTPSTTPRYAALLLACTLFALPLSGTAAEALYYNNSTTPTRTDTGQSQNTLNDSDIDQGLLDAERAKSQAAQVSPADIAAVDPDKALIVSTVKQTQQDAAASHPAPTKATASSGKTSLIALLIAGLIALGGGAAWWFKRNKKAA